MSFHPQQLSNGRTARLPAFVILGLLLALCSGAAPAAAHESRPAYLEINETSPGRYAVLWRTPVFSGMRLPVVLNNTSGFVYYVSITGITGAAAPDPGKVNAAVARIKRHTELPVAVGFGVRTGDQARAIAEGADGVVVGSALVDAVKNSLDQNGRATQRTVPAVADLVALLSVGVRGAKKAAAE